MRIKKKKWARPYLEDNMDQVDLNPKFSVAIVKSNTNVLEIGTGKGNFIFTLAKRYPEMRFFGIEKNSDVLALALKKINGDKSVSNIMLMRADMYEAKDTMEDEMFDFIFISHPDPWPKKKHRKRRLLFPSFLEAYYRILKDGGKLFFKTDDDNLFADSLENITEFSKFELTSVDYDYQNLEEFDVQTEYEMRFRNEGIKIKRLILKKEKKYVSNKT